MGSGRTEEHNRHSISWVWRVPQTNDVPFQAVCWVEKNLQMENNLPMCQMAATFVSAERAVCCVRRDPVPCWIVPFPHRTAAAGPAMVRQTLTQHHCNHLSSSILTDPLVHFITERSDYGLSPSEMWQNHFLLRLEGFHKIKTPE